MKVFHNEIGRFSSPYRLDRDCKGGGIMLYESEDILSNYLASGNKPIESIHVEFIKFAKYQNVNKLFL